jgi:hypothetical protein
VHPTLLLPKVKDKIFVIVKTISPFGRHPKGLFHFNTLKIKIMNTLDINTIAFQYLLRTESQKNNSKSEEQLNEAVKYNPEQYIKGQKSLLFHMYNLEEEDLYV